MGRVYDVIDERMAAWIADQPVFFVATTPADPDSHVNVSPKGLDTFRVLGPGQVGYLDLTGSGIETIAHLRADGRITVMFCAFNGPPRIVRLYGHGSVITPTDEHWAEVRSTFPEMPGSRAVILIDVERIADSCGYAVPEMALVAPRRRLVDWAEHRGDEGLDEYRAEKNAASIDGLPGLDPGASHRLTSP